MSGQDDAPRPGAAGPSDDAEPRPDDEGPTVEPQQDDPDREGEERFDAG